MQKIKKPKKNHQRQDKKNAFMSFLQAPTTTDSVIQVPSKTLSDNDQQYDQVHLDSSQCSICSQSLDPIKKKKCSFCNMDTCNNHLRKRRRLNKKFQRICDHCDDKSLYENYMKLQLKAEEALSVQEEIIFGKYREFVTEVQAKREKRHQLVFKGQDINRKFQQAKKTNQKAQQQLAYKQKSIQKQQLQISQLQIYVDRVSKSIKQNFQQDFKILSLQNQKLGKDLMNIGKRYKQIQIAIQKRQKQIEIAYQRWQKKQYQKNQQSKLIAERNKKKECSIY